MCVSHRGASKKKNDCQTKLMIQLTVTSVTAQLDLLCELPLDMLSLTGVVIFYVKQLLVLLCFRHLSFPNLKGHGSPQQ